MKNTRILFLKLFMLAGFLALPLEAADVNADDLFGKWAVSGQIYTYIYELDISGSVEKRIMMVPDTVVWTGTGLFTVNGKTLTVKLDETASNTPIVETFTVESLKNGVLKLRGKASYFSDIKNDIIILTQMPF